MSVLLETTLGEIVVDLYVDDCPLATKNFLKLCKTKYYNNVLFFNVQENFMVQTGDPTGTGEGGISLFGQLYGEQAKYFDDEIKPHLKHNKKGLMALANQGAPHTNGSQFYFTTRSDDLDYLDGKHTIFGEIAEGLDVLDEINALFVDKEYRPYQDVRINHTYVLDDPFPDPELLQIPSESPKRDRPEQETVEVRLAADEKLEETDGRTEEEIEQSLREKEAKSRAVVLEMIGDLPDADVKPPDEVLFVCKLNPVTESSDLDMAFCRFGPCKADVIRDSKTGDSLCFAFVEFQDRRHCEEAYFKMNNVLLDDRRIKVDFSQSVSKLWNKVKRRPWEKHTKGDGDLYSNEKRGGAPSGRGLAVGKNLRLKHQPLRRGAEFELVGSEDEDEQPSRRESRPPPRDKDRASGHDRDRDHRGSRGHGTDRSSRRSRSREYSPTASKRDKQRHRSRSREKEMKKSEARGGNANNTRSGRDRGRSRERDRDRSQRSRSRDRDRDRDRHHSSSRSSKKTSRRSRSASSDRGSRKRR